MVPGCYGKPTFVYRAYSDDGALLYVGIAVNIKRRFAAHKASSDWFDMWGVMAVEMFPTRGIALMVESKAIAEECPRFNKKTGFLGGFVVSRQRIEAMKRLAHRNVWP